MVNTGFPLWAEWVSLGLGAGLGTAAIILAVPPFIQMYFGRPRLKTEFERYVQEYERPLLMFLKNPPVNRFLAALGITRDSIQSLTVQFQVSEAGSGEIEIPIRQVRISSDDRSNEEGEWRIGLPPTYSISAVVEFAT